MTMSITRFFEHEGATAFSFEILPPLRGKSIAETYRSVDRLMEYNPAYINITTHRNEVVYEKIGDGMFRTHTSRRRPGTVAIAVALRERYGITPVPHIICGEFSRREIEDQLIDLSYMGITDILALRGDKAKDSRVFTPGADGHEHAVTLCAQIEDFNRGVMADGSESAAPDTPFTYGVAGYPEKHEEAMNPESDLRFLKEKVDRGAAYIVTQMFFDNKRYFDFVKRCRQAGITVPVIPGLKPLTSLTQMSLLPKTFHIDLPDELATEFSRCKDNASVKDLGVEWAVAQARELKQAGVPSIHFYSMNAIDSVCRIARAVY